MWPFKYINGDQTPESEALQRSVEADKGQHKPSGAMTPFDLNQFEDAPL